MSQGHGTAGLPAPACPLHAEGCEAWACDWLALTHSTSSRHPPPPVCRYGDLLAHWQLKAALRGEQPPQSADQLLEVVESTGATTQRVTKLERETESYWVAEFFRQAVK